MRGSANILSYRSPGAPRRGATVTDWKKTAEGAWSAPGWKAAAVEYREARGGRVVILEIEPERLARLRRLLQSDVSLERAYWETSTLKGRAALSTVEALMLRLGERGTKALSEAAVTRRLSELSERQLHEVCGRLQRLKPKIARAWSPDEIATLVDKWNGCHG